MAFDPHSWPESPEELIRYQQDLAVRFPPRWEPAGQACVIGGCYVCFGRGGTGTGRPGDPGWAAAALLSGTRLIAGTVIQGKAGASYEPGLLALREGPLLEQAVRSLPQLPDILLVNGTGRDHPRGAGLALHLGYLLDIPTIGVTHRPLIARGDWPPLGKGDTSPVYVGEDGVGAWMTTRNNARPLVVHPAWRTDLKSALQIVLAASLRHRTPEPLREARRLARTARSRSAESATSG